jgi:hypothetical protein
VPEEEIEEEIPADEIIPELDFGDEENEPRKY